MTTFNTFSGVSGDWVRTVGAVPPATAYAAWASELGVSATTTLTPMDADDAAFEFTFAAAALGTSNTAAFFSSEGGVGLYAAAPSIKGSSLMGGLPADKVSRMYSFGIRPDVLLTFHPQGDMRSENVKIQRAGTTTILTGRIRTLSSSTYVVDFAIRFNGNASWKVILAPVDQPINFFLFGLSLGEEAVGSAIAAGVIADFDFTALAYAPPVFTGRPVGLSLTTEYPTAYAAAYEGVRFVDRFLGARDFTYGGLGVISGTVKLDGTPTDVPVSRRVRLFRERDGTLVREQWSAVGTGAYSFPGIQEGIAYTVVSYDHTHNFRAVIADNITPDLMT